MRHQNLVSNKSKRVELPPRRDNEADVWSVSPSSQGRQTQYHSFFRKLTFDSLENSFELFCILKRVLLKPNVGWFYEGRSSDFDQGVGRRGKKERKYFFFHLPLPLRFMKTKMVVTTE